MHPATTTSLRALRGARRLVHLRPLASIAGASNSHRPVYPPRQAVVALTLAAPASFSTSSSSSTSPPTTTERTEIEPQVRVICLDCLLCLILSFYKASFLSTSSHSPTHPNPFPPSLPPFLGARHRQSYFSHSACPPPFWDGGRISQAH